MILVGNDLQYTPCDSDCTEELQGDPAENAMSSMLPEDVERRLEQYNEDDELNNWNGGFSCHSACTLCGISALSSSLIQLIMGFYKCISETDEEL